MAEARARLRSAVPAPGLVPALKPIEMAPVIQELQNILTAYRQQSVCNRPAARCSAGVETYSKSAILGGRHGPDESGSRSRHSEVASLDC